MLIAPLAARMAVMIVLCGTWMLLLRRTRQLTGASSFNAEAQKRDTRLARFYYGSVWAGLACAFLSFLFLDALAVSGMEPARIRDLVSGVLHGAGLAGVCVVAGVWAQVGHRAASVQPEGPQLQRAGDTRPRDRR